MASNPTQFKLQKVSTRVGPIALVTMDNGEDWQKPNTFGEAALRSLEGVLDQLRTRDWRGLLLTGKPFVFAVGADIGEFGEITPERARLGGEAGHELFGRIRELPFVTVAAINGAAVGGGVEIALHCDYRTVASSVRHFACPEVFLGLIPGWGGTQLVPQLVGAEQAVKFVVENPLRQNRMLSAHAGVRGRVRRRAAGAGGVPRRIARVSPRQGRGGCGKAAAERRSRRTSPRSVARLARASTGRCTAPRRLRTARSISSKAPPPGRWKRATAPRKTRSPSCSRARRRRLPSTRSTSSSSVRSEESECPTPSRGACSRSASSARGSWRASSRSSSCVASRSRSCSAT